MNGTLYHVQGRPLQLGYHNPCKKAVIKHRRFMGTLIGDRLKYGYQHVEYVGICEKCKEPIFNTVEYEETDDGYICSAC